MGVASSCCILSWGKTSCAGSMGSGPVGTESRRPLLAHRQVRLQDCVNMFRGRVVGVGEHIESVPQGSVGTFSLDVGGSLPSGKLAELGLACL